MIAQFPSKGANIVGYFIGQPVVIGKNPSFSSGWLYLGIFSIQSKSVCIWVQSLVHTAPTRPVQPDEC